MPEDFNFHKEEYLALRREIEITLQEFSSLRQYCVIAAALTFTWAASHTYPNPIIYWISWMIPTLISSFGARMAWAKNMHLVQIGKYIKQIECHYIKPPDKAVQGWEHYRVEKKIGETTDIDTLFWILLIGTSIIIGLLGAITSV